MIHISYYITSIIIILLPGPGSIYTISTAINHTKIKGTFAAIGCTLGILPHLSLGIVTIYMMSELSEGILDIIKLAGTLYLVYLGYKMITGSNELSLHTDSNEQSLLKLMIKAIFINLLNPKLTLFFISFLPNYIESGRGSVLSQALILGLVFMLLTLLLFIGYGLLANVLSRKFLTSPKRLIWMNRLFGILFILFAIKLYL